MFESLLKAAPVLLPLLAVAGGGIAWAVWSSRKKARGQAAWQAWQRHQQSLAWAQTLESLLSVSPTQFEEIVSHVLSHHGYSNFRLTATTNDRGVDLFCSDQQGASVAVQCKQYTWSHKVSGPEVRNFIGAVHLCQAQRGVFVTTSGYTKEATLAASAARIELIDGSRLVALAQAIGRPPAPARG
jgi:restriction endonuclease Mrr